VSTKPRVQVQQESTVPPYTLLRVATLQSMQRWVDRSPQLKITLLAYRVMGPASLWSILLAVRILLRSKFQAKKRHSGSALAFQMERVLRSVMLRWPVALTLTQFDGHDQRLEQYIHQHTCSWSSLVLRIYKQ